jgi:glyoxalase family protein
VDFYTRVLGMRLVKKTVNQDDPTVYHLFYGDEQGSPGFDMTFFEYPGARRGRAGDGMVHTVAFRVSSAAALDFWAERLGGEGVAVQRGDDLLRFEDPEGLTLEFRVEDVPDAPLPAAFGDVPSEHAVIGFAGVRAYSSAPERSRSLLEGPLAMVERDGVFEARGDERGGWIAYEEPPLDGGIQGAGTVHHVAWSIPLGAEQEWQQRVAKAGARATDVIDRFYFRSIYFREPSGVLFELATRGPGFTADEDLEHLGERVALPPFLEPHRERIEASLTPLDNVGGQRVESR